MTMMSQFVDMSSLPIFFWRCRISLVKFRYWFKYYVNIITCSRGMAIFLYNGLTRKPEIRNIPVWVFSNIWKLVRVIDTEFGTNFSNQIFLNTATCQVYSFYRFGVVKGNLTEGCDDTISFQDWCWGIAIIIIQGLNTPLKVNKNTLKRYIKRVYSGEVRRMGKLILKIKFQII